MSQKQFDPGMVTIRPRTPESGPMETASPEITPSVHRQLIDKGVERLSGGREFSPSFHLPHIRIGDRNPRKPELERAQVNHEHVTMLARQDGESLNAWRDRFEENLPVTHGPGVIVWEDLFTLAHSISKIGLMEPLVVDPDNELIAGERRYWAMQLLGIERVPVLRKEVTEEDRQLSALFENTQRSDLKLDCLVPAYLSALESLYQVDQWDSTTRKRALTLPVLMDTFAVTKRVGSKILRVCRAWTKNHPVKQMILDGKIKSMDAAYKFCDDVKSRNDHAKKTFSFSVPTISSPTAAAHLLKLLSADPLLRPHVETALAGVGQDDFADLAHAAIKAAVKALQGTDQPAENNSGEWETPADVQQTHFNTPMTVSCN